MKTEAEMRGTGPHSTEPWEPPGAERGRIPPRASERAGLRGGVVLREGVASSKGVALERVWP